MKAGRRLIDLVICIIMIFFNSVVGGLCVFFSEVNGTTELKSVFFSIFFLSEIFLSFHNFLYLYDEHGMMTDKIDFVIDKLHVGIVVYAMLSIIATTIRNNAISHVVSLFTVALLLISNVLMVSLIINSMKSLNDLGTHFHAIEIEGSPQQKIKFKYTNINPLFFDIINRVNTKVMLSVVIYCSGILTFGIGFGNDTKDHSDVEETVIALFGCIMWQHIIDASEMVIMYSSITEPDFKEIKYRTLLTNFVSSVCKISSLISLIVTLGGISNTNFTKTLEATQLSCIWISFVTFFFNICHVKLNNTDFF